MRASVSENKQFIVHSLRKAANLKLLVEGKRWRPRWSSENCSDTTLGEANKFFLRRGGKRRIEGVRTIFDIGSNDGQVEYCNPGNFSKLINLVN